MFSETLLDHFRNPRSVGELTEPAVTVEVTNPVCGDIFRLSARFESGRVAEARYRMRGCTASIAAGSAATEWLAGRTLSELMSVEQADIEAAVGGLTNETRHAAVLCVDGIRALARNAAKG